MPGGAESLRIAEPARFNVRRAAYYSLGGRDGRGLLPINSGEMARSNEGLHDTSRTGRTAAQPAAGTDKRLTGWSLGGP